MTAVGSCDSDTEVVITPLKLPFNTPLRSTRTHKLLQFSASLIACGCRHGTRAVTVELLTCDKAVTLLAYVR